MIIQRICPNDDIRHSTIRNFEHHVRGFLADRLRHHQQVVECQARLVAPIAALQAADAGAMEASKRIRSLAEAERKRMDKAIKEKIHRPDRQYSIISNDGLTIGVPPYDTFWLSSPLAGKADVNAGTFETSTLDTLGFQAAALGIFLSSPVPARVRFSADVIFHSVWLDWPIEPGAVTSSEGGVGVLVYAGNSVVSDQRQVLWSDVQSIAGNRASDEEWTFLTQTSAGQSYFSVEPGATYLVWVWAWTITGLSGNGLSTAHIDAQMPFVVVERL